MGRGVRPAEDAAAIHLAHHDDYADDEIHAVLRSVQTFAMVGASATWRRPSYYAMKYLQKRGFRVLPVNPERAGEEILGETVYAGLADIPHRFEMVDVFRPSVEALGIARETITNKDKGIAVLWMQLGVRDDRAAALAEAAGLTVIMNRCPKIEYARLSGELGWSGINTRIVSAKRPRPLRG